MEVCSLARFWPVDPCWVHYRQSMSSVPNAAFIIFSGSRACVFAFYFLEQFYLNLVHTKPYLMMITPDGTPVGGKWGLRWGK